MPTNFLTPFFSMCNKDRLDEFQEAKAMPFEAQHEQLFDNLSEAANTLMGKHYRFLNIHSYEDFRQCLPLQRYEDLQPYVHRMMAGESNLVWPGTCKYFLPAGNDGAESHLLPLTRDALIDNFFVGINDAGSMYLQSKGESCRLYDGFSLWIGADRHDQVYRNLSSVLVKEAPFPQSMFIRPLVPINKPTQQAELEALFHETETYPVSNIQGRPHRYAEFLSYAEKMTGKQGIRNILPQVEVFFHRGKPTREQLLEPPVQDIAYHASFCTPEGFFALQEKPGDPDMLLLTDAGIFYEFIAEDAAFSPKNVIPLEEVKAGVPYMMILSTRAGLWRYLSEGPAVVFTSTQPYKLYIK